jgi:hypothetical protein
MEIHGSFVMLFFYVPSFFIAIYKKNLKAFVVHVAISSNPIFLFSQCELRHL